MIILERLSYSNARFQTCFVLQTTRRIISVVAMCSRNGSFGKFSSSDLQEWLQVGNLVEIAAATIAARGLLEMARMRRAREMPRSAEQGRGMSSCKLVAAIGPIPRSLPQPRGLRNVRVQFVAVWATLLLGGVTLPTAVSAAATGQPAYALTPGNNTTAIDTGNRSVLRTITPSNPSQHIASSPDGTHRFVTGETPTGEATLPSNRNVVALSLNLLSH